MPAAASILQCLDTHAAALTVLLVPHPPPAQPLLAELFAEGRLQPSPPQQKAASLPGQTSGREGCAALVSPPAFVDIAVEELRPSYMRGSGAVPEDAVSELNGVVHELRSLVTGMERYLKHELTTDLEKAVAASGGNRP